MNKTTKETTEHNQCGAIVNQRTLERCKNKGLHIGYYKGVNYLNQVFSFMVYKCADHNIIARNKK